jgi:phage shock protein C
MDKRLQRSRTEKMIGGVCGGLAEYFDIDPTIVRILWVIITALGGTGILLYIVLWVIMPLERPAPRSR